ncbi:FAD/NAD(P)-binding protein [Sphingomonas sp. BIUV-7]|uniref:FAD/NAD(P)-binding protein n=1 Tax=Sphingomonas natans TaxID=3063330 RepID=A0ABT8Y9N8_9SPHN|nr:FAD/NAD(P)-binding protein [Sphingomonas sp. BIUV-7]MDO6415030.1 FAD/NAD(P)-binding protein [Sphingomonas sp. BIUV-7]
MFEPGTPPVIREAAIVGGGFSGALQAINLLRHAGPKAILIERKPSVGRGAAYSVTDPSLLLNVRAANMSAFPDDAAHFVRWLESRSLGTQGFVPRALYGEYLSETLEAARASDPGRIEILQGDAVRADLSAGGVSVALADGRAIKADALVLAVGNLPPTAPDNLDPAQLPDDVYVADPWQGASSDNLVAEDLVLIVGTGLTMVDAALLLDNRGFAGRIVALSRRGLLPRPHGEGAPPHGKLGERPRTDLTPLLREVRARSEAIGWHAAVDELRPFTQSLWLGATEDQRTRFLRHLRPWWEVHRHRLAPPVAARLAVLQAEGRLQIVAGKTLGFAPQGKGTLVRWRPRGQDGVQELLARRIVNCSGPRVDLARTADPLLRQLRQAGLIVPDECALGIAVDRYSRVVGASGAPSDRLFALGPLTRGTFWEITAVPDIRVQTWGLARRLSNAHWISSEGL